jgi:hypothetical protein
MDPGWMADGLSRPGRRVNFAHHGAFPRMLEKFVPEASRACGPANILPELTAQAEPPVPGRPLNHGSKHPELERQSPDRLVVVGQRQLADQEIGVPVHG